MKNKDTRKPSDFPVSVRVVGSVILAGFLAIFLAVVYKVVQWIISL